MNFYLQIAIIVIMVLLAISVWHLMQVNDTLDNAAEGYRIRARAYSSCPPGPNCAAKNDEEQKKSGYIIQNPFLWPYSGSMAPQVLVSKIPTGDSIIEKDELVLLQDTDHDVMSA
jgi:hypothetical protein